MTGLIERGAIALLRENAPKANWDALPQRSRETYRRVSRAYLEAIRGPTEKMLEVGVRYLRTDSQTNLENAFEAMIDAELEAEK